MKYCFYKIEFPFKCIILSKRSMSNQEKPKIPEHKKAKCFVPFCPPKCVKYVLTKQPHTDWYFLTQNLFLLQCFDKSKSEIPYMLCAYTIFISIRSFGSLVDEKLICSFDWEVTMKYRQITVLHLLKNCKAWESFQGAYMSTMNIYQRCLIYREMPQIKDTPLWT